MSDDRVYHIDLADFFAEVNRKRQAEGLPPVEPAVMAVRANIRLAIQRQRPLDHVKGEADLVEAEAQVLCNTMRELFNTAPELTPFAVAAMDPEVAPAADAIEPAGATQGQYALPLVKLYAEINGQRRAKNQPLIEPAVIAVRTGLRFTIMRKRALDFGATHLFLDAEDLTALDNILATQFNVSVKGGLASLCDDARETQQQQAAAPAQRQKRGGWFSRLLGRRRVTIDPLNLMLAVSQQRARMGHRPISPSEMKRRCQDRIALELEFKGDLDQDQIALSQEQLDALAEIIRKEFQVIFDNLEDFIDEARM